MCGIAGFWSKRGWGVEKEHLKTMSHWLKHRGRDAQGTWIEKNLGFTHRRLKILDLSDSANQPFSDGSDVLVFNGEIFNYKVLRNELAEFYRFKTTSDTEVLFRALQYWGERALDKLEGQFAFLFFNKNRSSLLISRDHVGICPLYIWENSDELLASSEIKPILALRKTRLSHPAIVDYFAFRYNTQNGTTFFEGIKRFPPGYYWLIDLKTGKKEQKRYWRLKFQPFDNGEDFSQDSFDRLLQGEIRRQKIADVPVGIFLSGGIDSRAILHGYSSEESEINAFTVSFGEDDEEVKLVQELQNEKKFSTRLIHFSPDALGVLEEALWALEEPFGDLIICANFLLAREASRKVKVVLSGEGGDETFMGYDHQRAFLKMGLLNSYDLSRELIGWVLRSLPSRVIGFLNSYPGDFGETEKRRVIQVFDSFSNPLQAYLNLVRLYNDDELSKLFSAEFQGGHSCSPDTSSLEECFSLDRHLWQSVLRIEIEQLTLIVNLLKLDRFGMHFGLESRVPLVSSRILEFIGGLPKRKLFGFLNKSYLRRYSGAPIWLRKKAFSVFSSPSFQDYVGLLSKRYLSKNQILESGFFSETGISDLGIEFEYGKNILSGKKHMALLVFLAWLKVFQPFLKD